MAERKRRHRWVPHPDVPDRDDVRACAHQDCGIHRREFGPERYEYRTADGLRVLVNQPRKWPAPLCPPSTQKDKP